MSLLSKVTNGRVMKPINVLLMGVEGIGKSTFASKAPKPIFIGAEENDELPVDRFPRCDTWEQFISYLDALLNEEHNFKTVVVDTIDSVEILLHAKILKDSGASSMAKACGGYGAGYVLASNEMTDVRRKLAKLRDEKGMNVVILAHTQKVKFEDPIHGTNYDTYEMKIDKRVGPLFKDWVSCILFANYVTHKTKNDSGKEILVGIGERKILTEKRPGHDGKNRFNLPYEMNLDWDEFISHVKSFYNS
jgi:hypothetical protein